MENLPRDLKLAIESRFAELLEMNNEMGGVYRVVTKLSRNRQLVEKVERMKLDRDKIGILQPVFHWTPSSDSATRHKFQKSSTRSKKYQEDAKALATSFTNSVEKNRAVKLANMITAFAEDAQDLAWGHYVRSQIFVGFGGEEACSIFLRDELERALKLLKKNHNHPRHPSHSNLKKQNVKEFLRELNKFLKSEFALGHLARLDQKKREGVELAKSLGSLKSPNKKAPALEDFVEIRYSSSRGRHVVVTKQVPAGTTLLVEKPFLSGLVDIFKMEIGYCHHCTKRGFKPLPCPTCVFVLFCSDKCREEAQNYHKYECPCFPDLHDILSTLPDTNQTRWLIAFKLICSLGPVELYSQFQREKVPSGTSASPDTAEGSKFLIQGCDPLTGIFDPSSFHAVRHVQRLHQPFVFQNIVLALALIKVIETRTDFFQFQFQLDPETKLQFKNYVVEILFQQFDSTIFYVNSRGSYRAAISPTVLLFSHSCDPNVIACEIRHGDGVRAVKVAARDLKAGEELCVSYTPPFYRMEKKQRQEKLMAFHRFKCDCAACSNFWPVMTEEELKGFRNVNPIFCCISCSKSEFEPKSTSTDMKKTPLILQGLKLKCPVCESVYEQETLMCQFVKHLNSLEKALNLIEQDDEWKGVKGLLAASTFFQENCQPPSLHQIKCQEILEIMNQGDEV